MGRTLVSPGAAAVNKVLKQQTPALYRALSPLGRRAWYPPDIPFQAQQARGKSYNSTIGVLTDGHGRVVPLPTIADALDLSPEDRDQALLYSPVPGIPELRERWREWQREGVPADTPATLPVVTVGLTHALSVVGDLFAASRRVLAIPAPFWGNYRQIFALHHGTEVRSAPAFRDGVFNACAVGEALRDLPRGEPAMALLNFPSNPSGYSPNDDERQRLHSDLLAVADERPLVVICDDAYSGLVYDDAPRTSLFWRLAGAHPNLVPIRIDGATKEFSLFGGRVGFLTFGLALERDAADALENKLKSLVRSTVGSPVAVGQTLLLHALRSGRARQEVDALYQLGRSRYRAVRPALDALDRNLLHPLPFNAGFFTLLELPEKLGLTAEEVRQHLLAHHDTGIVALGERYLRLTICSIAADALPELVKRVERGVKELAGRRRRQAPPRAATP